MKFELKTENEKYSKSISHVFGIVFILAILITLCDIALKLGIISRNYQVDHNCRLLSVEKSSTNFRNLSRISNLKSKQQIWEFCKDVIK
tara:strand:+ start:45 stop:311 length:267 start_codon:yes stop_codon:yes gene_type:complete